MYSWQRTKVSENNLATFIKLRILTPLAPAIPLLEIDSYRNKNTHMKDIGTRIFMMASFLMRNWKLSRWPLTED